MTPRTGPAKRHVVRLYERGRVRHLHERTANFDLHDNAALRGQLETLVRSEKGTLDVALDRFRIVVHRFIRDDGPAGRILARAHVDHRGNTVVTSRGRR